MCFSLVKIAHIRNIKCFHFQSLIINYQSRAIDASILIAVIFRLVFYIRDWEKAASAIFSMCKIFQCLYSLFNLRILRIVL